MSNIFLKSLAIKEEVSIKGSFIFVEPTLHCISIIRQFNFQVLIRISYQQNRN